MANTNGSLNAHLPPPADAGNSIRHKGFEVRTSKLPILKAAPIEEMTTKLGITPPEMIYGDNLVSITHEQSGWEVNFNAFDALDRVDKTGKSMMKVAYSSEWQKARENVHESINEVVRPFDWSYSTDYKGTCNSSTRPFEPSDKSIPYELLKRPDPILLFDDLVLYEDELADNGIAMLYCKIRVMPSRLLCLCRFFLRLDNVIFRVRDTRVYVDFDTGEVIREYVAKEDKYEKVKSTLAITREDVPEVLRDDNKLSQILTTVESSTERTVVG